MNKLIALELKRNSLRSYHIAVLISIFVLLGILYLLAAIPKLDPAEADLDIFMSYNILIEMVNILCMVIFTILSAVMSARFIIEEYSGRKAILLFSYPVKRKKVLAAKLLMILLYTVITMFLCGLIVLGVFFTTESIFPLCTDQLNIETIMRAFFNLFIFAMISASLSIISLWFGFLKKSISVTIVAAVVIVTFACQIMAFSLSFSPAVFIILAVSAISALLILKDLFNRVENMEV